MMQHGNYPIAQPRTTATQSWATRNVRFLGDTDAAGRE